MTKLALGNAKALTVRCLSEVSWHDNARMRLDVLEAGGLAADQFDVNWTPGNAARVSGLGGGRRRQRAAGEDSDGRLLGRGIHGRRLPPRGRGPTAGRGEDRPRLRDPRSRGPFLGNAGRRPCTGQDAAGGLGVQVAEAIKRLDAPVVPGKVKTVLEGGRAYYAITEPAKS